MAYHPFLAILLGLPDLPLANEITTVCRNPLFENHWFCPGGIPASLREVPGVESGLRLCAAFDGAKSCCQESFEVEQELHFSYWRQILKAKLMHVKTSKLGTMKVMQDPEFNAASDQDRDQFEIALMRYDMVLDPAAGHATCFAALLTYIAGMMCFGCKPNWMDQVQTDSGKLVRVLVSTRSCSQLWSDCEAFAVLARNLREAILDSSLAIRSASPMEHLQMFEGQQKLCDWAHDVIAMHPFTQPGETEREATPPLSEIAAGRRLESQAQVSYNAELHEYDTMKAGRASGFDMTWDGMTAHAGADRASVAAVVMMMLTPYMGLQ